MTKPDDGMSAEGMAEKYADKVAGPSTMQCHEDAKEAYLAGLAQGRRGCELLKARIKTMETELHSRAVEIAALKGGSW